jgi:hypothetical protein
MGLEGSVCAEAHSVPGIAGVAQSVEHLICNQRVGGSNPFASSRERIFRQAARLAATGFSNALHSELFPACSDLRSFLCATLVFLF